MRRRAFLGMTAAGLVAGAGLRPTVAQARGPAAAALVVTDITPMTDAANLVTVLETFATEGLWVTAALSPEATGLDGFGAILDELVALAPAVEIALDIPGLSTLSPHFQGRAVVEAREKLAALAGAPVPVVSVLTDPADRPRDPVGVRSAGVRNVLVRPDGRATTRSEHWTNGVVRFRGGTPLTPASPTLPPPTLETQRLFFFSADSLADRREPDLRAWASRLARGFTDAELAGEMTAMPVSELQLRDDFGFTRHVVVHLVGERPALDRLEQAFARRGLPVRAEQTPASGYWVAEPDGDAPEAGVIPLDTLSCDAKAGLTVTAARPLPSGVAVVPVAGDTAGLDGCGALRLRQVVLDRPADPKQPLLPPGGQADVILTIYPGALADTFAERALLAHLDALLADGITRFTTLDRLANTLLSHDPVERRFRRTHAVAQTPAPPRPPFTAAQATEFMDDARRAWDFFARFTDPTTGLCPATANVHTGGDALTWVTMWDVGSQINARVAA